MDAGLTGTLAVLWSVGEPDGCRVVLQAGVGGLEVVERLRVLPSATASRYVVSAASGPVSRRLLTSHNGIRSRRRAWQRSAAGLALGFAPRARRLSTPLDLGIEISRAGDRAAVSFPDHLRAELGRPDALLALGIREISYAHSKPVVQLFEASGAPLAYAKLGWSPSTAPLVRHEAGTLSRVAERGALPGVRSAALLGHGTWRGHPYLVLEPLPAAITTLPRTVAPPPGSRAVAGTLMEQPVADSPWWRQLTARVAELGQGRIDEAARRGVALLRGRVAERRWTFGAWHGDWTWWNVGECDSELWAWDWEHYAASAPYGFDDLHWSVSMECQILGKPLPEAVSRARQTLGRAQARSDDLMLAYLTEMAVRSAEVSAHRPDAPLELHEGLTAALNAEIARG